ncbi:DUF99 family protein [Candidatus Bathyarchaeota archaeon]|nr:DUF99 family protein [Candidatus Bathyarchaeota archaeon]
MPVIGIDDGGFEKGVDKTAILVAVLIKDLSIHAVRFNQIQVDGLDATEKAIQLLEGLNFEAIMLAGVSFAGFNIIDPTVLLNVFGKPTIIVSKRKPNNKAVKRALFRHFKDWRIRWSVFEKLGEVHRFSISGKNYLYFEVLGLDFKEAIELIKSLTIIGRCPEPVRVAKLIAHDLYRRMK